jgi:hypothetical protein
MPQAKKGTAVIRVARAMLTVELPFPVCRSRVGEMICNRETLVERIKQQGVTLDPQLEQGLHSTLEELGEFTDSDRLGAFSFTLNYVSHTPAAKRAAAAKTLKQALQKADFEVLVQGSDTTVMHEVAAAA